ncbi:putative cation/H+ exchanger, sodium/solute symporter superfamily [Helianthus annuus]|nr:putative cation/H+ exchanger, sodium/solute symporter superfamily [Helianthus annuus]
MNGRDRREQSSPLLFVVCWCEFPGSERMSRLPAIVSSEGYVPGVNEPEQMICQYLHMTNSMGCSWSGCDISAFSVPLLILQLCIIFFVSQTFFYLLKPLRQSILSCQLIGCMVFIWFIRLDKHLLNQLFPESGKLVLSTVANFGYMLHVFVVGVQIDTGILRTVHRHMVLMGCMSFLVPYAVCVMLLMPLPKLIQMDEVTLHTIPFVVALTSMTTFPAVTSTLSDLNLLNSDLGRLSCSTALVTDFCSWITALALSTIGVALERQDWKPLKNVFWIVCFLISMCFVLRPFVLWMAKRIPEGQDIKESQFLVVLVTVLLCGFLSECLGQNASFGGFTMGICVPDGPPFGSAIVNRVDWMATTILVPAKFAISAFKVNLKSLGGDEVFAALITEAFITLAYMAKFISNFVLALYFSVPLQDAFHFSMIMCTKGIIDVSAFSLIRSNEVVTDQAYSLLILNMLLVTGSTRILLWHFYDPSTRYQTYKRNSILESEPTDFFRMVVCIHNDENVTSIINLLEVSNPTRHQRMEVTTMSLHPLEGRASAILVPISEVEKIPSAQNRVLQMGKAFYYFMERNHNSINVEHFVAMAPYGSMHEDVITIAINKCANIVIVPFHKRWAIDGSVEAAFPGIRSVNLKIMEKAPCSIGILVDRGQIGGPNSVLTRRTKVFRITQLFLGGADDREALAYSSRIVQHHHISLLLVMLQPKQTDVEMAPEMHEKRMDHEIIDRFRMECKGRDVYIQQEAAKDAQETMHLLREMEKGCDLFIVGREHGYAYSQLTYALSEWSQCPELGRIGDLLATSEFKFSVLVVQQQPMERIQSGRVSSARIVNDSGRLSSARF